jgi:carbon-monoxide dehydrogenase medium subunit
MMAKMKPFQYLAPIAAFEYVTPKDVDELLNELSQHGSKAKLIAGGTDLTIALKERLTRPEVIIDLNHLRSKLSGIEVTDTSLKIGSMTTYTEVERNPNVQRYARALSEAASQVGTFQIRNLGTIGANLANGSPAADTAPPLIVHSAKVNLRNKHGERKMSVEDFITGVKKTAIQPDELITYVEVPLNESLSSYWMRAAKRNENVISVVSVAVASEIRGNSFGNSKISLGAVAPTPILAKKSSSRLTGSSISDETIEEVAKLAKEECEPITDVRASAGYRRHLVQVLTKRTIRKVTTLGGSA